VQQASEARVASQRVELGIRPEGGHSIRTGKIGLLQPGEGLLLKSRAEKDLLDAGGGCECTLLFALFGWCHFYFAIFWLSRRAVRGASSSGGGSGVCTEEGAKCAFKENGHHEKDEIRSCFALSVVSGRRPCFQVKGNKAICRTRCRPQASSPKRLMSSGPSFSGPAVRPWTSSRICATMSGLASVVMSPVSM
jgi:hypothetical protein